MKKFAKISLGLIILLSVATVAVASNNNWFTKAQSHLTSATDYFKAEQILEDLPDSQQTLPGPLRKPDTGTATTARGKVNASDIIRFTNAERVKAGLAPLKENVLLKSAAQIKLSDMFAKQYFDHVSPVGEGPSDVVAKSGYEYILVGENLALGNFSSGQDMVEGWMNSPGHKANILHFGFTEIGVAVGQGKFEGKTVWIGVQSFGKPLSDCPEVDQALKQKIEQNQTKIFQMEQEAKKQYDELESGMHAKPEPYNSKVEEYNDLVEQLNALIEITKSQVEEYNRQVNKFNSCAEQHS